MVKINRKGKNQNRVLLITSRHLLNLMPDNYSKCNRCMQISQLHHITKVAAAQEFVVHFADEYDYRFKSPYFEQAVKAMQAAYQNLTGNVLSVVEMADVDGLAAQVMTKASVKKVGGSWGPNPLSAKLPAGAAATAAFPAPPSAKAEADENDSEEEAEPSARGASGGGSAAAVDVSDASAAAPPAAPVTAGGAFAGKSKYSVEDFTILKVLGKGAFGKVRLPMSRAHPSSPPVAPMSRAHPSSPPRDATWPSLR